MTTRSAIILAGGKSTRMGMEKSLLPLHGVPLIKLLIATLISAGFDVILSGPHTRLAAFKLPIIEDVDESQQGPLSALEGIWRQTSLTRFLVVACDMPLLTLPVVELLWRFREDADITILEGKNGPSPLPGVYSRRTHSTIQTMLKKNRFDLKSLFSTQLTISSVSLSYLLLLDPKLCSLTNINTPGDLKRASCFFHKEISP